MLPQDAERVFDRFWRADPSRQRRIGGTGLGLAISLEDAQLHGGAIEVWTAKGDGTNFVLTLPRRPGLLELDRPIPVRPADAQPEPAHRPERRARREKVRS
jgi:two-component system sensor histidine kinase MtrB